MLLFRTRYCCCEPFTIPPPVECVALGPELIRDLLRGDRVDGRLDLARRHRRREDLDVRAEVRLGGLCASGCSRNSERTGESCNDDDQPRRHGEPLFPSEWTLV